MKRLPNVLTLLRIILVPAFVWFFAQVNTNRTYGYIRLGLFVFKSLTDFFVGCQARKYQWVSDFGKIWDPFADKLLVYSALFLLVWLGRFPLWAVLVLLVREIYVTLHRDAALRKKVVIAAVWSGKIKTVVQLSAIIAAMLNILTRDSLRNLDILLLYAALILTVYSGIDFYIKNRRIVTGREFLDQVSRFFLSLFYLGHIRLAPGTWGSLAAVILWVFWGVTHINVLTWLLPALFILGLILSNRSKDLYGSDDASPIIMDEFVAQFIPLFLAGRNLWLVGASFILFRIFDIWKPFPVSFFDKMKNGVGIMMDDVAAGVMSGALIFALLQVINFG
ncbi:CDP-diacylglycerol--glycerol-3-phosphate 3-phosphatidyltransferase [Candidatus Mcinerneyibacteriota bacterium]|nr:CDP-diacylglycerol--glycerol-3-phosphate 3-phosphatidyltransferase [Candidatus Mcinerneyibacteriota bacterium]